MGGINMGRVLAGGLAAGLVINVGEFILNEVVLASDMEAFFQRFGLPQPAGATIGLFVLLGFVLGITTIWLYAAIRPRYGPGAATAVCAGLAVWFLACVYPNVFMVALGIIPAGTIVTVVVWELVELALAAVAGAWLYREDSGTAAV